ASSAGGSTSSSWSCSCPARVLAARARRSLHLTHRQRAGHDRTGAAGRPGPVLTPAGSRGEHGVHDLVIRAGTVVDGTGAPARTADVAITGGIITEVGRVTGPARRTIDADGALVTPGFVDVH